MGVRWRRFGSGDEVGPVETRGEVYVHDIEAVDLVHDAVFGEATENDTNYRTLGTAGTAALMMKTQVGLGVLSIPQAFNVLGLGPGVVCVTIIAAITTWSDYMVGVFKLNHPDVYSLDDVGGKILGRAGRGFFSFAFYFYWVFVSGSGMSGLSIGLNALSSHGACTASFVAVAAVVGFGLSSIKTLNKVSWIAWVGLAGILSAIVTLTISVAVQDRPATAPQSGPWSSDWHVSNSPGFAEGISAISSIVFAFSGTPGFFGIVSEMKQPKNYTKAMIICQSVVTATYIIIGVVVYYFCGSYVASPALGSAGIVMKKICYGLALPGLVATICIVTHLPAKFLFIRCLQGTRHLTNKTWTCQCTWFACTGGTTLIAYVIASAIPGFGSLVSLIGAILGTLMSFQPMGLMWLYDNTTWWNKVREVPVCGVNKTAAWKTMVVFCIFVIVSGTFIMCTGTYGAVNNIIASYAKSAAWSCADNSLSQ